MNCEQYEYYSLLEQAIAKWGKHSQILMVFEEMGELQKALSKYFRSNDADQALEDLAEELVDVEIMLDQLKIIFFKDNWLYKKKRKEKIERLKKKVLEDRND